MEPPLWHHLIYCPGSHKMTRPFSYTWLLSFSSLVLSLSSSAMLVFLGRGSILSKRVNLASPLGPTTYSITMVLFKSNCDGLEVILHEITFIAYIQSTWLIYMKVKSKALSLSAELHYFLCWENIEDNWFFFISEKIVITTDKMLPLKW